MKISNEDLRQLTELKQYFLDPPTSFRLYAFTVPKMEAVFTIVSKYRHLEPMLLSMRQAWEDMQAQKEDRAALRKSLVEFARLFNYMNQRQ